jgi:threonyl-tRNA synthetase
VEPQFISQHKAKHLLAHVLVATGARRWPQATLGDSGETSTGFFADFAMPDVPGAAELARLGEAMARLLSEFRTFRGLRVTPAEARSLFAAQPWKQHVVEALAELDATIGLYELDGVIDVCDCAIKRPGELLAIRSEQFRLTGAASIPWIHRGRTTWFVRVRGEIVPVPPPCGCCPG